MAHLIVTGLLWYIGLIPDLASLRDRSRSPRVQKLFGVFALGWRGAGQHWVYHRTAYGLVAGIVIAMVVVIQTTVSFEFAATLVPDWHKTRLPLHFVVTGLASGLAIVLATAVLLRRLHGLETYITRVNVDLMGILLAANGLAIALVWLEEYVVLALSGPAVRDAMLARLVGDYGWTYWSAFLLTAVASQALWSPRVRHSLTGALIGLHRDAGGRLARPLLHHRGGRRARLPAVDVARLHPDRGRIADPVRQSRAVRRHGAAVRAVPAGRLDVRAPPCRK
jgi:hypothetical protein